MITVYGIPTSLDELRRIPLVRPEKAGCRWKGVQHGEAVDAIIDETSTRGWSIGDMKFSLNKDNTELAGGMDLVIPEIDPPDGQRFSLGILTSNARTRAMRLYVGTMISICNNGMATGEMILTRKHERTFNFVEELEPALDSYFLAAKQIPLMVERLKETKIGPSEAEHILMEAGRRKLMPWAHIGLVDKEFRLPRHADHGSGTSWALLQSFTEIVKRSPPRMQMDAMNSFRDMLPLAVAA